MASLQMIELNEALNRLGYKSANMDAKVLLIRAKFHKLECMFTPHGRGNRYYCTPATLSDALAKCKEATTLRAWKVLHREQTELQDWVLKRTKAGPQAADNTPAQKALQLDDAVTPSQFAELNRRLDAIAELLVGIDAHLSKLDRRMSDTNARILAWADQMAALASELGVKPVITAKESAHAV